MSCCRLIEGCSPYVGTVLRPCDTDSSFCISKLHLGISACNAELRQHVIGFAMHWPSTSPSCPNGLVELLHGN